jgi:hypothetical protein
MQVKVIVADIDDNGPTFLAHNMTLGKIYIQTISSNETSTMRLL